MLLYLSSRRMPMTLAMAMAMAMVTVMAIAEWVPPEGTTRSGHLATQTSAADR